MTAALEDAGNTEIRNMLSRRAGQYTHAIIRSAIAERAGEWSNCLTTVVLGDGDSPNPRHLAYVGFEIHEDSRQPEAVLEIVDRLVGERTVMVADRSVCLQGGMFNAQGSQMGRRVSANEAWTPSEWPGDQYLFRAQRKVSPPYEPLIAKSLPAYPSGFSAIQHIMGMDASRGSMYDGGVYFFFPDYRARIDKVTLGVESVSVHLSRRHSPSTQLVAKVYGRGRHGQVHHEDIALSAPELRIGFGFQPEHFYIGVLNEPDGELLTQWELSPYRAVRDMTVELSEPETVRQLVSQGENDAVEFKPGVRDDEAKREWAETAIAFANRGGGVILVGVDDNGRITGAHGGDWTDLISESLRDRSEPPILPEIQSVVAMDDRTVYVVRISESPTKPHLMKNTGTVYLRVGSTDKPVTRYELDELYQQRLPAPPNPLGMI